MPVLAAARVDVSSTSTPRLRAVTATLSAAAVAAVLPVLAGLAAQAVPAWPSSRSTANGTHLRRERGADAERRFHRAREGCLPEIRGFHSQRGDLDACAQHAPALGAAG